MFKIILPICVVIGLMITSCAANSPPLAPTSTSQPQTPTQSTYLSYPKTTTIADTEIYAGPGNLDYEVQAKVPSGTEVFTLGVFGDFVKMHDPLDNLEGYVRKENLKEIVPGLPTLTKDDIPWVKEDYIAENCMGPFTSIDSNGTAKINDFLGGYGGNGAYGGPIILNQETQLVFDIQTNNNTFLISVKDTPIRPADNANWMIGYRKITIFRYYAGYNGYSIEFRDGLSDNAILIPLHEVNGNPFKLVILDPYGEKIEIRDLSDKVLYQYDTKNLSYDGLRLDLPNGFFPEKKIYIDCATGEATMNRHEMLSVPSGQWKEPESALPSLRALGEEKGVDIIVPLEGWRLGDKRIADIYQNQMSMAYVVGDMITEGKFWTGIGKYNFEFMDHLLEYYRSQGWSVTAALASGNIDAGYLPPDLRDSNLTRDEYLTIFHDYVTTIACRYKDQVDIWQIAGESFEQIEYAGRDYWATRIGGEYIDLAYKWVRECDPEGILMLSHTIDSPRDPWATEYLEMVLHQVAGMISRGVPVDAIGFEGHLFLPWDSKDSVPTKEGVIATMQRFDELGLDVYITEMDVSVDWYEGTQVEKWTFQAEMYKLMMDACLEAGNCKGFGFFGIDDANSWLICPDEIPEFCRRPVPPEPLLFDNNFKPKPAFWALVQSLEEHQK